MPHARRPDSRRYKVPPKFRGGSDDFLDDEDHSGKSSKQSKKKTTSKSAHLSAEEANATVMEVFPNQCRVHFENGELLCTFRRSQLLTSGEGTRERSLVAVGDRVKVERIGGAASKNGVVEGIAERRNFLARPAPGRDDPNLIHVIAANVDLLVIVVSCTRPEFSPGLVDRYLIAAQAAGIEALLCVTKADLVEEPTQALSRPWDVYQALGVDCILTSARTVLGTDALKRRVSGKTAVFCGHSGVGKTSLFRMLIGEHFGKIGDVNIQTGKGKHTTTSAVLYREESSHSNWIDTPGIKEFGILDVTPERLREFFPEFQQLDCTNKGCLHVGEIDCQATELLRHPSYLRIYESLVERNALT
jgi:ribosome biogenesis GTPase